MEGYEFGSDKEVDNAILQLYEMDIIKFDNSGLHRNTKKYNFDGGKNIQKIVSQLFGIINDGEGQILCKRVELLKEHALDPQIKEEINLIQELISLRLEHFELPRKKRRRKKPVTLEQLRKGNGKNSSQKGIDKTQDTLDFLRSFDGKTGGVRSKKSNNRKK